MASLELISVPGIRPDTALTISQDELRRRGPGNLLAVCWRQWRAERDLARRGIHFRSTDPDRVGAAYAAMSADEFEFINGRQEWANWRTIPRALDGRLPDEPWRVFDLGCGTGTSTRVLASLCPLGSVIVGYELARPLVDVARRRRYPHRSGRDATVHFVCQPVTEPWRLPGGDPVPDGCADLVNACGIVGHHLDPTTVRPLLAEVRRVVHDGGLVLLDDGPTLSPSTLVRVARPFGLRPITRVRACLLARDGQVVFRRQSA